MARRTTALTRAIAIVLLLCFSVTCTACGMLLYPERRGQTSGRIDPAIAVLDGVGVLVFVIPGLIAFGVDFATGAIYLPSGRHASGDSTNDEPDVVRTDPDTLSIGELEAIVSARIGEPVRIDRRAHVYGIADAAALGDEYAKLDAVGITGE